MWQSRSGGWWWKREGYAVGVRELELDSREDQIQLIGCRVRGWRLCTSEVIRVEEQEEEEEGGASQMTECHPDGC